jgi:hypothetical protein
VVLAGVGDVAQAEAEADGGEHDRHGEQPRPGEVVDHERRDEQAEDATGTGEAGPDADRPGPVLLGEGGGDDRQGDRHDHGGTDAGDHPGDEQHLHRRGDGGGHVGGGEHGEARQQDVLAAPPVADGADRQEQRGQGDGVAVDDPQQLALGGTEVEGEVLLGDVETRHRGDDRHERHDHRDEDPALALRVGDEVFGGNVIDVTDRRAGVGGGGVHVTTVLLDL